VGIETHLPPAQWAALFAGREAEFKDRLIHILPEEKQAIRIIHPEPESPLTSHLHRKTTSHLGPSEVLALEDILFDNRNGTLILPFMPEYDGLARHIDDEIPTPHNSALSFWLGYGHLLYDQFSNEGIYQLHSATRGLPMAFNFFNNTGLSRLVETQWKYPHLIIRKNITRFKKLNVLIHRHHEIKQAQAHFMKKEFGTPDPGRLKSFFLPKSPARRIYLARTQGRKVINDEQLTRLLKAHGFERWQDSQLNEMTIREQAALFHSAEMIVSPHGSHLANGFFCRPDAKLIELFKFCWIEHSPFSILRSAASSACYAYLIDWQPWETYNQTLIHADIRVNKNAMERVLAKMA
jgi:hypothetical protein